VKNGAVVIVIVW